jgi:hypothetical protein
MAREDSPISTEVDSSGVAVARNLQSLAGDGIGLCLRPKEKGRCGVPATAFPSRAEALGPRYEP